MNGTSRGQLLALIAAAVQATAPAFAAGIPATGEEGRNVGILRVGQATSAPAERAYRIVERRVQRWLENEPALAARVEPLAGSVRSEELVMEAEHARLAKLVDKVLSGGGSDAESVEMERLVEKLGRLARFAPTVQRALVARGARLAKAGDRKAAIAALTAAAKLHPDGMLPGLDSWDEPGPRGDLESLAALAERAVKRTCAVSVSITPKEATVRWNGFDVGGRRSFHLAPAQRFTLTATAAGHRPTETVVTCHGTERRELRISLEKAADSGDKAPSLLSAISARRGLQTLCLIEPQGGEFKLYLYTPASVIEEIPLRAPLRVADVLESPGESELPIATDAFVTLLEKQRVASAASDWDLSPPAGAPPALADHAVASGRWYNSSTFWWVTGGLVGGILLTFLATRGSSAKSQPGVTLHLD